MLPTILTSMFYMLERDGRALFYLSFFIGLCLGIWWGLWLFALGFPSIYNRIEFFEEEELPMIDLLTYKFPYYDGVLLDDESLLYASIYIPERFDFQDNIEFCQTNYYDFHF